MESLTQIINILKPGETRLIRSYYNIQSNGEGKRRLQLFDLIKDGKVTTDGQASKMIYGKNPNSAFSHLKARLKRDLLNILLLQDSSKRYETKYAQEEFDCRRLMITGDLLVSRGAYTEGVDALMKAEVIANKYELYSELTIIQDILRRHLGVKAGINAYSKYSDRIENSFKLLGKTLEAKDFYNKILVPNLFQKNKDGEFQEFTGEALSTLKSYFQESNSAVVGYYYYNICIYYYEFTGNLEKALDYSYQFLQLIESRPAVNSKTRIGGANLQIASILIHLGFYQKAAKHAEVAYSNFKDGMLNQLMALDVLFFACYRGKDYQKVKKTIENAQRHPKIKSNKHYPAKWSYYQANLEFTTGHYDRAYDILMDNSELLKDKSGWLLGHKILEILILAERGQLDLISYRVETFRKLLQRHKEENIERAKCIVRILEAFEKKGYDFEKTYQKEQERFEKLREGKGAYLWDPMGYELIRFDEWFISKIKDDVAVQ